MRGLITTGSLWNFRKGDIICKDNVRYEVRGYDDIEELEPDEVEKLWGYRLDGKGNLDTSKEISFDSNEGLILLERPSLKFKVEDQVLVVSGNNDDEQGTKGLVIVLNPANVIMPYLVSYREDSSLSLIPWVPKKYKKPIIHRKWRSENQLKSIK